MYIKVAEKQKRFTYRLKLLLYDDNHFFKLQLTASETEYYKIWLVTHKSINDKGCSDGVAVRPVRCKSLGSGFESSHTNVYDQMPQV